MYKNLIASYSIFSILKSDCCIYGVVCYIGATFCLTLYFIACSVDTAFALDGTSQ